MQQVNNQIQFKSSILKLQELAQLHFTGSLLIQNNSSRCKIYFRLGRLIWLIGEGNYFKYQWKRHIRLFLSDLSMTEQEYLLKESQDKCYKILAKLYNQKTSKNREKITDLITNLSVEVIFYLIQYESTNINKLSYQMIANDKIENIISFIKFDDLYSKVLTEWNQWANAGLSSYSPHLFPVIKNSQLLQKQFELKFISLINGKINLKELAFQSQLDLVTFAKYLLPLIKTKAIVLQEIPKEKKIKSDCLNLNLTIKSPLITKKLNKLNYKRNLISTVYCVDDSLIVCRNLEKIVSSDRCDFIGIQNPLEALPFIIKNPPDLIFLDLIMPIINGYELCSQLRIIPNFKSIPIIILTGKDGLIDRLRARVVGATDFISKNSSSEEILKILDKYLVENRRSHLRGGY